MYWVRSRGGAADHTQSGAEGTGSLERMLVGGAIVAAMLVLPDGLWGGGRRLLRLVSGGWA